MWTGTVAIGTCGIEITQRKIKTSCRSKFVIFWVYLE